MKEEPCLKERTDSRSNMVILRICSDDLVYYSPYCLPARPIYITLKIYVYIPLFGLRPRYFTTLYLIYVITA